MDTAIIGTITLSNLDVDSYSSVIFRADITPYGNGERRCNGDDTGRDIDMAVDESREVFTVRIFDACPSSYRSYGSYILNVSISKTDTTQPSGRVELASARTQFMMTRYLNIGVPTATPPEPSAQAWADPDPRTLEMYANGEWHLFHFRSNIQLYLNDHLGVQAYGLESDHMIAGGESAPRTTVEEACRDRRDSVVNWRRAINQGLYIAACKPGDAFIALRHETDGVAPLYEYRFRTLSRGGANVPEISITAVSSPVIEGADATFTLERSGATTEALTVNVSVVESGNMLDSSVPDRVSFGATASSATLRVPTDDDGSEERDSVVTATVQADTGAPARYTVGAAGSASVTVLDDDAPPPPPVPVPVNSAPEFQDANGNAITETTREVAENTPAGADTGDPVAATDDDDTLTYTLGGADADSFAIDGSTGQLMTKAPLDEEKKNSYSVTVTATDPFGASATITVSITVTDVDFGCSTKGAVVDAANNPGLVADCEALLESRDALAGTVMLNWAEDTSITQWDGTTLRGTPTRVVWLNLREKGLSGTVPAELGQLSMLTYLNLRSNELTGGIPAELGSLSNLGVLNLHSNDLTGAIPSSLGSLSNLRELWLHANDLTGSIPSSLGNLSNLEKMKLRNNDLSGPIPSSLGRLDKLEWLVVHNNRLSGSIPASLGSMDSLQILWLGGNELTGSIPMQLGNISTLTQLHLRTNQLTGSIPAELKDLTNLKRMWLHSNQLTGSIPSRLGDLANLEILNLRDNGLTGGIPTELGRLDKLKDLLLHENRLTGPIPTELADLTNLRRMWLSQNQLSGSIPAQLGGLSMLTQLNLHTNQLSGPIPSRLGDLGDTLNRLRIGGSGNAGLTGCVPASLAGATDANDLSSAGMEVCPGS